MILEVALNVPVPKTFDYLAPDRSDHESFIGRRVKVLFGPRWMTGIVVGEKTDSNQDASKLKKIVSVIDSEPVFDARTLEFGRWLAKRTVCSLGDALWALLPPGKGKSATSPDAAGAYASHEGPAPVGKSSFELSNEQKVAVQEIHEAIYHTPKSNHAKRPAGFLLRGVAAAGKTEVYLAAIKDALDQGKSALYVVPEIGLAVQTAETLRARFGADNVWVWHSDIPVKDRTQLWWDIKNGKCPIVVGARSAALLPMPDLAVVVVDEEQDVAFKEDRKPRFHVRDVAIERARQAHAVVIFGSATPSLEVFQKATDGELQLIELDERVVLASAPHVHVIDMRKEKARGPISPSLEKAIANQLKNHEQAILFLNRRGFHRFIRCPKCDWIARCPNCGVTLVEHKVPSPFRGRVRERGSSGAHDSPALTQALSLKGEGKTLTCHYCASSYPFPSSCPECGHKKLFAGGTGTERVEEEIKEKFPWAHIARWDRDNVKKRGDQEKIFADFREQKIDILIGTQMVAQGFNFPNVTLVGVIDADVPLRVPNFRAAEHAFQLITQIAGRAGRALVTGDVFIQTREPQHDALVFAEKMDFEGFAKSELRFRNDLNYPPFVHLVHVHTTSKDSKKAEADMEGLIAWVQELKLSDPVGILGPTKSRRKKKGAEQFQTLLKVPPAIFDSFLGELSRFLQDKYSRFWIDSDPL